MLASIVSSGRAICKCMRECTILATARLIYDRHTKHHPRRTCFLFHVVVLLLCMFHMPVQWCMRLVFFTPFIFFVSCSGVCCFLSILLSRVVDFCFNKKLIIADVASFSPVSLRYILFFYLQGRRILIKASLSSKRNY